MDRFIGFTILLTKSIFYPLKSNMDRFIAINDDNIYIAYHFKIQYG